MKNFFKGCVAFTVALLFTSANAQAGGLTSAPARVTNLFARDAGMDIYTDSASNPMSCPVGNIFRIQPSLTNNEALISTVLTAYTSGKSVLFWVSGCDTDGVSIVAGVKM